MSDLVGNPEDRFSQNEAQMIIIVTVKVLPHMHRSSEAVKTRWRYVSEVSAVTGVGWDAMTRLPFKYTKTYFKCLKTR